MKIDIFSHILPPKYFAALRKKNNKIIEGTEERYPAVVDLDVRIKLLDRYPGVLQVLTVALQQLLDEVVTAEDSVEIARIANDELAEIVVKHPNKFYAAVACLPLRNIEASLEEVDRAIGKLGLRGIQIHSEIGGDSLDNPKFKPLWEKMAKYDLPIWIHPNPGTMRGGGPLGETQWAMHMLVSSGVFRDHPDIKFITHHCGANIPLEEARLREKDLYRKFYADTATYGSTAPIMCSHSFFGADHLLFGTDTPLGPMWGCTLDVIRSVERMTIPDEEKQKIFFTNAVKLIKLNM